MTSVPYARLDRAGPHPLSFNQERLWFMDQLSGGQAGYHARLGLRLVGSFDPDAWDHAVGDLIARHEPLRTHFSVDAGGRPVQRVMAPGTMTARTKWLDLRGVPDPAARASMIAEAVDRLCFPPFDLRHGPLLRCLGLAVEPDDHRIAMVMHEVVVDGWSSRVIIRDLAALYQARVVGRTAELPSLPVQLIDYAAWQRSSVTDEVLRGGLEYWRAELAGAERLRLPTDYPVTGASDSRGGQVTVRLSQATTRRLVSLARSERCTPYIVLLAGFRALLGRWTGRRDVVVGTVMAGRSEIDIPDDLVGFFVNTVAVRSDCAGERGFRALLRQMRAKVLGAMEHQVVPFDRVVATLGLARESGGNPLFPVIFAHNDFGSTGVPLAGAAEPGDLVMEHWDLPGGLSARFDLEMFTRFAGETTEATFVYRSDLFRRGTVDRLADVWCSLMERVVARPDEPMETLPFAGSVVTGDGAVVQLLPRRPGNDVVTPSTGETGAPGEATPPDREAELSAIWCELLGLPEVRPDDNFFAIGGYSLLAAQLVSLIRDRLNVSMDVRMVFERPTLRRMAAALDASAGVRPKLTRAEPGRRVGALSFGQQRLWFLEQLEPGTDAYHMSLILRMRGVVDAAAMRRAMSELIGRHEALRTVFSVNADGEPCQRVLSPPSSPPLAWSDLRTSADAPARLDEIVRDLLRQRYVLSEGPLIRGVHIQLGSRRHALALVVHHLVADGRSLEIAVRDLAELYEAQVANRRPSLPELPVQYLDFAMWQRGWLDDTVLGTQLDFWRRELDGYTDLALQTDRARTPALRGDAAELTIALPATAATGLAALAREAGCTVLVTVLATCQMLLSVYSGQTDVVLGVVTAGRDLPEVADVMGFFANTVVIRGDVSGDPTFRQLLARVRQRLVDALRHQDVPFDRVVADIAPHHERGHGPLLRVVVQHLDEGDVDMRTADRFGTWTTGGGGTARFDLEVHTTTSEHGLHATFVYRANLFDHETVAAMAASWRCLLTGAVAAPDRPIRRLSLVSGADAELLDKANPVAADLPAHTVVELVSRQARLTPTALAVIGAGDQLTYQQLDRAARAWELRLRGRRVGRSAIVGVCCHRDVSHVALLLGILRAGAAYLPLDPRLPVERLGFMLSDAQACLVVASQGLAEAVPAGVPIDVFDEVSDEPGDRVEDSERADPVSLGPDDLAYVMYTSGSTGRPKAVAVNHRGVVRLVAAARSWASLGAGEALLQLAPLSFDASTLEIWGPLAAGGTTVAVDVGPYAERLGEVLRTYPVTVLNLVPAQLEALLADEPGALAGVRQLHVGGDVVSPRLIDELRSRAPHCEPVVNYGPTETTMLATVHPGATARDSRIALGRPLANTTVHLLDASWREVPVGAPGEIWIGGAGVARGYLRRPSLTAERFVPDPFGPKGSRAYRTGDVCRRRADGAVEFLGRVDGQVKILGHRIELAEIEHALARHPDVRRAVVAVRALATGQVLVGYVLPDKPAIDLDLIKDDLTRVLPRSMTPSHLIVVPKMPLTANNKVDRAALPDPVVQPAPPTQPLTHLEATVADAWSRLLERLVGREDDFFAAGGHSLLAVRATAAVRQAIGREVPLQLIFSYPTLSAYVRALHADSGALAGLGIADAASSPAGGTLIRSNGLDDDAMVGRRIDMYVPTAFVPGTAGPLLIGLDGPDLVDVIRVPASLDLLDVPLPALFVGHRDWATRNAELASAAFIEYLLDELAPRARARVGLARNGPVVLAGASAGGLAGYRAAALRPELVTGVISLSGSFGVGPVAPVGAFGIRHRFYFYVGEEESTLVDATRRLARDLAQRGARVRCDVAPGGHTFAAWQRYFNVGLRAVMQP